MNFAPSANPPSDQKVNPVSSDQALYQALQAAEGTWFDIDLSAAGVNADKSFEETIAYIQVQLGKVRGCQKVESVWGGNGKPYQIRLTSGLKVPKKQEARIVVDDEGQAWDVDNPGEGYR